LRGPAIGDRWRRDSRIKLGQTVASRQVEREEGTLGCNRDLPTDLRRGLEHGSWVGIGEVGLDFVRAQTADGRPYQEAAFRAHLHFASELALAMVIRAETSLGFVIARVRGSGPLIGGVIHGFRGSAQRAIRLVKFDFDVSAGPAVLKNPGRRLG
jgi:Tat protein secretion system quality control protein TatD with DNase activity